MVVGTKGRLLSGVKNPLGAAELASLCGSASHKNKASAPIMAGDSLRVGRLARDITSDPYPITAAVDLVPAIWKSGAASLPVSLFKDVPHHRSLQLEGKALAILSDDGMHRLKAADPVLVARLKTAHDEYQERRNASFMPLDEVLSGEAATVSLDWAAGDVSQVLIDREAYGAFVTTYRKAVALGEAPAKLAGKMWTDFFRPTDDMGNEIQVEGMRRISPEFQRRSLEERRTVAALAHRRAGVHGSQAPLGLKLATAEAMIDHHVVAPSPEARQAWTKVATAEGLKARPFHHGTQYGKEIAQDGFKISSEGLLGPGVYHGNPSDASRYAGGDSTRPSQIVSGRVLPGATDPLSFYSDELFPSSEASSGYINHKGYANGYWVTKEPGRFQVRGITSYDPSLAPTRLGHLGPALLDNMSHSPEAAFYSLWWLGEVDVMTVDRTARATLRGTGATGARMWLASRGDDAALSEQVNRLASTSDIDRQEAVALVVAKGLSRATPDAVKRHMNTLRTSGTFSVVEKVNQKYLSQLKGDGQVAHGIVKAAFLLAGGIADETASTKLVTAIKQLIDVIRTCSDEAQRLTGANVLLDTLHLARVDGSKTFKADAAAFIAKAVPEAIDALGPETRDRLAQVRPDFKRLLNTPS
jgi:hypothetical protein